jgi:cytochrome c556
MVKVRVAAIALAVSFFAFAGNASTPPNREANFKSIARANKTISDELRKEAPSADVIRAEAAALKKLSAELPSWFPKGSGPESGAKTGALPTVWTRPDDFKAAAARFDAAIATLNAAAASGDVAAIRTAAGAVGGACKSCHESFRAK